MQKVEKSFLILNGKAVELSNLDVHNIELSLLVAQEKWLSHNATTPVADTIPLVDFIAESGLSYWRNEVLGRLASLSDFYTSKKKAA